MTNTMTATNNTIKLNMDALNLEVLDFDALDEVNGGGRIWDWIKEKLIRRVQERAITELGASLGAYVLTHRSFSSFWLLYKEHRDGWNGIIMAAIRLNCLGDIGAVAVITATMEEIEWFIRKVYEKGKEIYHVS